MIYKGRFVPITVIVPQKGFVNAKTVTPENIVKTIVVH